MRKNKLFRTIAALTLGLTMTIGVSAGIVASNRNMNALYATGETDSISFDMSNFSNVGGSYDNGAEKTGSVTSVGGDTYALGCKYTMSNSGWQWQASNGIAYNTDALPGRITNISVTQSTTRAFTVRGGTSTCDSNSSGTQIGNSQSTASMSWDVSAGTNYTYFVICRGSNAAKVTNITVTFETSSGGENPDPTTYTGVEVSEKTALTGTYKGEAYYECQATVSGTGSYSSTVAWSITDTDTYGTGKTIADVASIDDNGKITFLDNVDAIYVWATAADGTTHNASGFSVSASGLLDDTIPSWIKITDSDAISINKVYALSNDGSNFGEAAVSSSQIPLTTKFSKVGYIVLEPTSGGYYARFATYENDAWVADTGEYINWTSSTSISGDAVGSTVWTLLENDSSGVYLKISDGRHLGVGNGVIKAYANIGSNAPVYLWEVDSLPVIDCDSIELTGKPTESMSIGDTATLGYYALGTDSNEWTGDVVYSISNEKDANNQSTTGVVELSATSGASVTLTAKKAGTARVSVQDKDEKADADYVDVTVLADPERTELPVANYDVEIDYSGVKKNDTVPDSKTYEIKDKEGTGANRVWYKNMSIAYSNVTASYDGEYTFSKDGNASNATITTTSEVAKVTQVIISYYNGNRLTLTDAGSNVVNISSYTNNVCTYSLNSSSFTLSSTSTTTSIYYIHITFTVADENEEFLSLVISKGTTATSFTEGDAPNATGLTVYENYSTDGSTISRSEDVTSSVTWNYSIETIASDTVSYTVTATYGGHTSAAVTIDGFTVTALAKFSLFESDIAEGDYIIYYNGKALKNTISSNRAGYSDVEPVNNAIWTNAVDIVWHIAKSGDYYTIYNAQENKYLAATGSYKQAQLLDDGTDDKAKWTITSPASGTYEFENLARSSGTNETYKWLRNNGTYGWACYATGTGGALSLYRKTTKSQVESLTTQSTLSYDNENDKYSIRFGGLVSKALWDELDGESHDNILAVGVLFSNADRIASLENIDSLKKCYDTARAQSDSIAAAITKACNDYGILYRQADVSESIPALTGENCYKWNLVKKVSSDYYAKEYVATAYIITSSDIIFLQQASASVNGLLAAQQ